jgi:uncharacterized membrane protein YidH (DUF202 family)
VRVLRIIGIVLIIAGIAMLATGGFHYKEKKKVLDTDIVDISRTETKVVTWPGIAGVVVIAGGIVLLIMGEKNKEQSGTNSVG